MLMKSHPDFRACDEQSWTDEVSPVHTLQEIFELQNQAHGAEPDVPYHVRRDRLNRLLALIEENESAFVDVINMDFHRRSPHETRLSEIFVLRSALMHARRNLKRWMRERRVATGWHFLPGRNRLMRQPLGVVGIISPWNYPLQLSLAPAIAALAAGNRVMIKTSELTPQFSMLLEREVKMNFEPTELAVVTGGPDVGEAFSKLPFHHLFYTGSTTIGRKVAVAAAANLTPVTLELGGKSPTIIDSSADFPLAASRIAFGKWMNAGQTCVAPDYLLVPRGQAKVMSELLVQVVTSMFPTLINNPDYTAVISESHLNRLRGLVEEARSVGSQVVTINPQNEKFDDKTRKFPPTLVLCPSLDTRLMTEEIFGPVLPIIEYDTVDDAIRFVNERERPLALYWFGRNGKVRDRVLNETISGGVTVNDCLWHLVQEEQPFGGIGESGIGSYHGEWGFRTFSKEKPVFHQSSIAGTWLFYPPYGWVFDSLLRVLRRIV